MRISVDLPQPEGPITLMNSRCLTLKLTSESATDPERFWDYYQTKVLSRIYDHVMRLTNNRPTADQPTV